MGYALQHFRAIEYGYKIETLRSQRDGLTEMNRALRLEEASLRDPERIDVMARKLGLQSPQPGQVQFAWTLTPMTRRASHGQRDSGRGGFGAVVQFSVETGLAPSPPRARRKPRLTASILRRLF